MTQLTRKETILNNLNSFLQTFSLSTSDKLMAEVISSHNKTYLLVYHEIIFKVLSFHRLSAWVKHPIVDVNIQGVSYAKNSVEFPIPTELQ